MNSKILTALALGAAAPVLAQPQPQPAPRPAASPAETPAAITALRDLLRERYVLPDTGAALDRALAEAERRGEFRGLAGEALAVRINAVMDAVTPDGHLLISYDPVAAQAAGAMPPPGPGAAPPPGHAQAVARANAGIARLEVLPGGVRYVDYTQFMSGAPEAERALASAAEFLRGGDAIIIDLRRNRGGSANAVAALASYFLPADSPLMRFQTRGQEGTATASKATPFTLADRPVYVLTSGLTFSAAEEFAAHVAAYGFATLVGETTGGGGFNNTFFPLPGGYRVSISTGQATQAKTGQGWERTGIAPAIRVPADRALDRAMAEAMTRLATSLPAPERGAAAKLATYYRALAEQFAPVRPLGDYAGTFADRTIALDSGGALTTRKGSGPASRLVAIGPDLFAPDNLPSQHFRFVAEGGRIVALEADGPGGPQRAPRSGGAS